jgi:magnesium transporter
MISLWQQNGKKLVQLEKQDIDTRAKTWVDARSINREDIRVLQEEFGVQPEDLTDILDTDELSRIERDIYTLVIVRIPLYTPDTDVSYSTTPLGIMIFPQILITICWTDCDLLRGMTSSRLSIEDFPAFVINILTRADATFLRYLKEINRSAALIQTELQLSIENDELIKLLDLEKSLVFFTTSLKSNQLLIEKIAKTKFLTLDEDDHFLLSNVEIDNRQAIEMADTYSDIMSGMMDAYASVISNNLNIVMKRLTTITLILMLPTFIVSFFGMNVTLPFQEAEGFWGIAFVACACLVISAVAYVAISLSERHAALSRMHRRPRKPRTRGLFLRPRKHAGKKS